MADHTDGLSGQVLAFVGDSVFHTAVRERLVSRRDLSPHMLHRLASAQVNAAAQSVYAHRLLPLLTERELAVFMRGRNAHTGALPKHASVEQYREATALEAVIGYLHLKGESARLNELINALLDGPVPDLGIRERPPVPFKG